MMKILFQTKTCVVILTALLFSNLLVGQEKAHRIEGSPFPVSSVPEAVFVVEDSYFSQDELLTVNTLQGVLAKKVPLIYRRYGSGYAVWLQDIKDNYSVNIDTALSKDFDGLIEHFKDSIEGYVLCNLHDNSSNTAISLCGVLNAIAVTPENISLMDELEIELLEDVRSRDELWAFNKYGDLFSKEIVIYQNETKDLFLSDYSVYTGAFHFSDDINSDLTNQAFSRMDSLGFMLGWGDDEYYTVAETSSNSLHVLPADWAINISTLSNMEAETRQKMPLNPVITQDDVHTVCFVVSDGDNIQWMLSEFGINEAWYGSPDRGKFDLGWTISPALCEVAPTVMKYMYDNAADSETGRDYFIAGPSGTGYNFPSQFPAINQMSELLNEYMIRSDLNIVNVLDQPATIEGVKPYLEQEAIDAVFLYPYANYYRGDGSIEWYNHKPVISPEYSFWEGVNTPESMAEKLNASPRNPKLPSGYSLVPVHAWSIHVSELKACVDLLDEKVRVVAPDEFVELIKENLDGAWDLKNIAHQASVTVSSESQDENYSKDKVIDQIPGASGSGEWASDGETTPWVQLSWPEERRISRIVLYDRPSPWIGINEGLLTFSDGSSIKVGTLPGDGAAYNIDFAEKEVSWVKFQVTAGKGANVGLSEIEVIEIVLSTLKQELQERDLSVYPNPGSNGVFRIDLPANESFQLAVYNISGTLMKQMSAYTGRELIDIRDLPHGIYLLELRNANRVLTSRIIHQ